MSELNLILVGPPGAGKGTQANRLRKDHDLPYYSTGDILRAAVSEGSPLGKEAGDYMKRGDLVPDEVMCEVIMERVDGPEAAEGFLLDGFPRTVRQAEVLSDRLDARGRDLTAALLIDAPDEEVIKRLSGRRVCSENQHTYHVEFQPPEREGICDKDGSPLLQRDDDREETVSYRLRVFHDQTKPLIEWYEAKGLLRRFDGARAPDEVQEKISATLAELAEPS